MPDARCVISRSNPASSNQHPASFGPGIGHWCLGIGHLPMYKLLLTFRYLRRKLIPIFALLAVMLCTAMVIIVISVMGGFLDMVKNAGKTLMGDVSISAGLGGFSHYEGLIQEIEKIPEADAATPIVVAYGLLKLPGDYVKGVQVYGIDGAGQDRVTQYRDTMFWTRKRLADPQYALIAGVYGNTDPVEAAMTLTPPWKELDGKVDAAVIGIEVSPHNFRRKDGSYEFYWPSVGEVMTLSVLPVTKKGGLLEPKHTRVVVVNEFNSGVYDVDSQRVIIPFKTAQDMMNMTESQRVAIDDEGNVVIGPDGQPKIDGTVPARCTEVQVSAAPGVTAEQLRDAVENVYKRYSDAHPEMVSRSFIRIETWQQRQAKFLSAVENEKGLMSFLFSIISIVAVAMVGVIFYMIVLQKTRDIGILRAIGASQPGIASIFLLYGAVIGLLGAALGTALAYAVVLNINAIHEWLGNGWGAFAYFVIAPCGGAVVLTAIGAAHALVETIFDRKRLATFIILAVSGAVLGLLAAILVHVAMSMWPGRYAIIERLFGAPSGVVVVVKAVTCGLVALAALDGVYCLVDWLLGRLRRPAKVALLLPIGAVVSFLVLLAMNLTNPALAVERLNADLGFQIWDRSVYFFDKIPSRVDWREVVVIVIVAVASSTIGALIPALRAAFVDPVRSLRYE
ncbi:MAG: hypothetical protein GC159_24325 [Phycisphaera sp.]|nr:hypothetical protein [Phycisphaera sp.]